MRSYKNIALASLLMLPQAIYAQESAVEQLAVNETEELEQLLQLLEEQTTLATKSRLNADYVPGMMTVLHGKDLEKKGARTVWEALAMVPGVELAIEEAGRKQVVIRGVGRTYASGNTKILLNGISMNSSHLAHAEPVMDIPIEQVERIEVIRGPGSAIHGEFALTGVINVITHKEGNRVYVTGGENSSLGKGLMLTYDADDSPLKINLSLADWETDGPDVIAGEDELYIEDGGVNASYSNAPGPTNEAADDKTGILTVNYEDFSLNIQWLEDGYGDYFGRNQFLPHDEKRIVLRNKYRTVEVKQALDLSHDLSADIYAGWQDNEQKKDDLFAGPSAITLPSNDVFIDTYYREQRSNAGIDLNWTGMSKHNVLLGFEYVDINVDKESLKYFEQGVEFYEWYFVKPDKRRRIFSTIIQDEFKASEDLTLTIGMRHDNYNDIDSKSSPRLAAVYRKDRNNIFKAQYARAFRPLTFYEIAEEIVYPGIGNFSFLTPEDGSTIGTYEFGYIHKNMNTEYALTAFHSEIDKLVIFVDQTGFANADSATMSGMELEVNHQFSKRVKLDSNVSYLNTDDDNTGRPLPGSTNWIGNIGLDIKANAYTNISLQHHMVGETYREATDARNKLNSYRTTDLTVSMSQLFDQNVSFYFGVKNVFDSDVKFPAPELTYVDDHPRAGSQWWMRLAYDF